MLKVSGRLLIFIVLVVLSTWGCRSATDEYARDKVYSSQSSVDLNLQTGNLITVNKDVEILGESGEKFVLQNLTHQELFVWGSRSLEKPISWTRSQYWMTQTPLAAGQWEVLVGSAKARISGVNYEVVWNAGAELIQGYNGLAITGLIIISVVALLFAIFVPLPRLQWKNLEKRKRGE